MSANVIPFEQPAQRLISRLNRVSQHGADRWRAVCPAHESKHNTQSLAIRELSDGSLLIRCHAGCGAADVVGALGLELRDLFPTQPEARRPTRPNMWHAQREAVQTLTKECLICAVAGENVAKGIALEPADVERVTLAASRIRSALEACK